MISLFPLRCLIPECELKEETVYEPPWIENAMPFNDSRSGKCHRYVIIDSDSDWEFPSTECDASQFNKSKTISCYGDDVVYRNDEFSAQKKVRRRKYHFVMERDINLFVFAFISLD